ncbi:MAG: hypothetical protein KGL70_11295, partial [Betaproteobacteria bacterium]|nr:hypothetical protein [Betaproteobacteria bacterium]
ATWWVVGGTLAGLALVLYVPAASAIFRFGPPDATQLLACAAAAIAGSVWLQLTHRLRWHNRIRDSVSRPPLPR